MFEGCTFGQFLKAAGCRRAELPEWWCAPITVCGESAFYLGRTRASVNFCRPDGEQRHAHPSDVLPQSYRPAGYRQQPELAPEPVLLRALSHLTYLQNLHGGTAEGAELMTELRELAG